MQNRFPSAKRVGISDVNRFFMFSNRYNDIIAILTRGPGCLRNDSVDI